MCDVASYDYWAVLPLVLMTYVGRAISQRSRIEKSPCTETFTRSTTGKMCARNRFYRNVHKFCAYISGNDQCLHCLLAKSLANAFFKSSWYSTLDPLVLLIYRL